MAWNPSNPWYRYTVLLVNCLLTSGSYYCFDMPSVLESHIEEQVIRPWAPGAESTWYNSFYTAYAWTNAAFSLVIGYKKCAYIFLTLCLVGQSLFALGPMLTSIHPKMRFVLMFIGRLTFGLGGGSITIVQNAISAKWFKGKEIAMAFGMTLTVSRLGSVVNFDLTSWLYKTFEARWPGYGLSASLWVGAGLIALSMFAALAYSALEAGATRHEDALAAAASVQVAKKPARRPMRLSDITELPAVYWICCLTIVGFYNEIFPFLADAKDIIEKKYHLEPTAAGVRASLVYTVSMVVSPFLGRFVDYFGRRAHLALFGSALTIPVFVMFATTSIDPIVMMLMLGIAYSICAASLWPSIQLLVNLRVVGTANGVATSMQMVGIGICNIVVGRLDDGKGYGAVLWFFVAMGVFTTATALTLIVLDRKHKVMYMNEKERKALEASRGANEATSLIDANDIEGDGKA